MHRIALVIALAAILGGCRSIKRLTEGEATPSPYDAALCMENPFGHGCVYRAMEDEF